MFDLFIYIVYIGFDLERKRKKEEKKKKKKKGGEVEKICLLYYLIY